MDNQNVVKVRMDRVDAAVKHFWEESEHFQLDADKQMSDIEWECVFRRLMQALQTNEKPTFGWIK